MSIEKLPPTTSTSLALLILLTTILCYSIALAVLMYPQLVVRN